MVTVDLVELNIVKRVEALAHAKTAPGQSVKLLLLVAAVFLTMGFIPILTANLLTADPCVNTNWDPIDCSSSFAGTLRSVQGFAVIPVMLGFVAMQGAVLVGAFGLLKQAGGKLRTSLS